MATSRDGHRRAMDALISSGGWNVRHAEAGHFMQQPGYHGADVERMVGQVKSGAHIKMAFSTVAQEVEAKTHYWLARALAGDYAAGHEQGVYVTRDGHYHEGNEGNEGNAEPLWWHPLQ